VVIRSADKWCKWIITDQVVPNGHQEVRDFRTSGANGSSGSAGSEVEHLVQIDHQEVQDPEVNL
jgi:hypothetical protein